MGSHTHNKNGVVSIHSERRVSYRQCVLDDTRLACLHVYNGVKEPCPRVSWMILGGTLSRFAFPNSYFSQQPSLMPYGVLKGQ